MPKLKQPKRTLNKLEDYLTGYDSTNLVGVLETLENSLAWEIYKSYVSKVQRQYEVEALDAMAKEGSVKSAAFASGYAKCAEDMLKDFMEGLKKTILNVNPVIENAREEE